MPGKPPYFPFYPKDFAADGVVESMTTEQVGAYILLLCKAWSEEPPGTLPKDETVLARWARLTPERWSEARAGVLAAFTSGADNRWHQKRMRKEYAKLIRSMIIKSEAGKKGAEARWQPHTVANGNAIAVAMPSGSGSGSGSETHPQSELKGGVGENEPPPDFSLSAEGLAQLWCFQLCRRNRGAPADDPVDKAPEVAEMLRKGMKPEALRDEIMRPERDRSEYFWELRKRLAMPSVEDFGKKVGRKVRENEARRKGK